MKWFQVLDTPVETHCECGKPVKPSFWKCADCLKEARRRNRNSAAQKSSNRSRELYKQLREEGRCTSCHQKSDTPEKCLCSKCRERKAKGKEKRDD